MKTIVLCIPLFISLFSCQPTEQPTKSEIALPKDSTTLLFTLLDSSQSGVNFRNDLIEGPNTNILMYEYFYNGGGVATADFNQDGWIDLYFTSNMGENKLFLNQKDIHFKEVSQAAGATGRPGPWKTGVTVVDINADRKMDIYLCYSGAMPTEKRVNQLLVNQGNTADGIPIFKDEAQSYGLASAAFSNQAYFFDYDRDQDLDMLLLNHNPKSLPVLNEASTAKLLLEDDELQGLRLFRQDNGKYHDITVLAKIRGTSLSYGLSVAITDINADGWPDFYVCNDYTVPDYLYINNHDGTFTDRLQEMMGHNSHFSMGNDAADVNNDGWADLFTLDMLPEDHRRQNLLMAPDNYAKFDLNLRSGFHYQYMRNMLQLNNGDGTFSEVGQLAGISNTDWSWSALFTDFDQDGWKDLYITNGYLRDYTNLDFINYMDRFVKNKGRLQREDVLELIKHMPSSNMVNYMYSNQGSLTFKNTTAAWGLALNSNSNGAAYADLDNDGDQDLIVNNINQQAFIFRNEVNSKLSTNFVQLELVGAGKNTQAIGTKIELFYEGQRQMAEQYLSRGYLSAVSPVLHFGLGKATAVDSILVYWPGGKVNVLQQVAANQRIVVEEKSGASTSGAHKPVKATIFNAFPDLLKHQDVQPPINDFNRQPLLLSGYSLVGPYQIQLDANGDRLMDIVIGGAAGQATRLYLQSSKGAWRHHPVAAFEVDAAYTDTKLLVLDANQDGKSDVYVSSGGYGMLAAEDPLLQDRLYLGDGQGGFQKSTDALPVMPTSTGAVASLDLNGDKYPDLVVGGRVIPGQYPSLPRSYILLNDGTGHFKEVTEQWAPGLSQSGLITDILPVDLNADHHLDLLVVGEWMPVSAWVFNGQKFEIQTRKIFGQEYQGWWNCVTSADLNGDNRPDFIVGNWGLNSQVHATMDQPAELYFNDFDGNGSIDPIYCFYNQGYSYPYLTRDDLGRQLTMFQSRFPDYASYASTTLKDLFTTSQLAKAEYRQINTLETSCFLSTPEGRYVRKSLPTEAQLSPIHTITVLNANNDSIPDLLLCGNTEQVKLRLGKQDSNYGLLLVGQSQGDYKSVSSLTSGLRLKGDVRSVQLINDHVFFGIQNRALVTYRINNKLLQ